MMQENRTYRRRKTLMLAAAAGAGMISLSHVATGGTFTWGGTFSPSIGDWSNTANWSPATAPGRADLALFGLGGRSTSSAQVTNKLDAHTTSSSLWYAGGQAAATGLIFSTTSIPTGVTLTVSNTGTGNTVLVGTELAAATT